MPPQRVSCPGRDSVHRHNHFLTENCPIATFPLRRDQVEQFRDTLTVDICQGMALDSALRMDNGQYQCFFFQGQILANNVAMDETEVAAKNGRIYTLTGVLVPPSILPILPHRCNETKSELKLVKELRKSGKSERVGVVSSHRQHPVLSSENVKTTTCGHLSMRRQVVLSAVNQGSGGISTGDGLQVSRVLGVVITNDYRCQSFILPHRKSKIRVSTKLP